MCHCGVVLIVSYLVIRQSLRSIFLTSKFIRLQIQETAWFQWVELHINKFHSIIILEMVKVKPFYWSLSKISWKPKMNFVKLIYTTNLKWFIHLRQMKKGEINVSPFFSIKSFLAMAHELFVIQFTIFLINYASPPVFPIPNRIRLRRFGLFPAFQASFSTF